MVRDYTDDDIRRDAEYDRTYNRRYDRRDDNGLGWLSLLLIPVLAFAGWWAYNTYKNRNNTAYNRTPAAVRTVSPTNSVQRGVGGGPNSSPTPMVKVTVSPSPTVSLTPTSSVQQGQGGSGYSNTNGYVNPTTAPQAGQGGMGY